MQKRKCSTRADISYKNTHWAINQGLGRVSIYIKGAYRLTHKQTSTPTHKHTENHKQTRRQTRTRRTDRKTNRQTDKKTDRQSDSQTDKKADRQTNRPTARHASRLTDGLTNTHWHMVTWTNRQRDKQTHRQKNPYHTFNTSSRKPIQYSSKSNNNPENLNTTSVNLKNKKKQSSKRTATNYSYRLNNRPPGVGNYSARVGPGEVG